MPPSWRIHRQTTPHPQGQWRWDQAYQSLARWATGPPTGPDDTSPPPPATRGRGSELGANRPPGAGERAAVGDLMPDGRARSRT